MGGGAAFARPPLFALAAAALLGAATAAGAVNAAEPEASVRAAFALGAGSGFRLSAEGAGATTLLRASADDGGSTLAVVCALCAEGELAAAARSLGARVAALAASREPCRLEVAGLPEGASLAIDGVPSRSSGPTIVEPGPHEVRTAAGGELREASVDLAPGTPARLTWSGMRAAPRPRRAARVGIAASGVGLALAAAGSALLLLDGDCATFPDATGHCGELHRLAPAGWSLVGTGAAAVLFGVVFGVVASRRERAAEVAP